MRIWTLTCALAIGAAGAACGGTADENPGNEASSGSDAAVTGAAESQQAWWDAVQELCGNAYAGEMVRYDPEMDTGWLDRDVVMHVRECSDGEIRIPLHVGDDRSRTWVLVRTADGIRLKHDHRHEDGTADESTWYGGDTAEPGTANRQQFPADEYSRQLFVEQDHPDGVHNVWIMEVHPGERFVYNLTRPDRDFAAEFDLTTPVEAPPAPWGSEDDR
jgi:hypothetical protein